MQEQRNIHGQKNGALYTAPGVRRKPNFVPTGHDHCTCVISNRVRNLEAGGTEQISPLAETMDNEKSFVQLRILS
jgi:hypothetical protein